MGVLIKGIDMPKNCDECPCYYETEGAWRNECEVLGKEYTASENRPEWCPLVELPSLWDTVVWEMPTADPLPDDPRPITPLYGTADATTGEVTLTDEPVGHWRKANDRPRSWVYICSECGETAYFPNPKHFHSCGYKYCPNCGVPMAAEPK